MIKVTVEFKGYLKQYTGHREPVEVELPEGAKVENALSSFKIPPNLIKLTSISETRVGIDHLLNDGDVISIHPVVLGG